MVGKLKDDCQKYTEYVHKQVLKSYLYQWRIRPGFPGWWRRRCFLRIFFFFGLVFRDILIIKQGCDQHSDKVKTWGSDFYLLKKRREGRSECLFGVLLLLKIGLEISFSYELSPLYNIPYIFSQWPHLSELEHHSRYLAYRLAERSWSAAHSYWLLEDSDHHPAKSRS